jgi:hypothetical protein
MSTPIGRDLRNGMPGRGLRDSGDDFLGAARRAFTLRAFHEVSAEAWKLGADRLDSEGRGVPLAPSRQRCADGSIEFLVCSV